MLLPFLAIYFLALYSSIKILTAKSVELPHQGFYQGLLRISIFVFIVSATTNWLWLRQSFWLDVLLPIVLASIVLTMVTSFLGMRTSHRSSTDEDKYPPNPSVVKTLFLFYILLSASIVYALVRWSICALLAPLLCTHESNVVFILNSYLFILSIIGLIITEPLYKVKKQHKNLLCFALGHKYKDWMSRSKLDECSEKSFCVRCATLEIRKLAKEHEWGKVETVDPCKSKSRCTKCGCVKEMKTPCTFGEWAYDSPSSCVQTRTCTKCSRSEQRTEHRNMQYVGSGTERNTLTDSGDISYKLYRCLHCGYEEKDHGRWW